jgi:hypothetical protein
MSDCDKAATIERYPCYDDNGKVEGVSYGCPDLGLMGYTSLPELLFAVFLAFRDDRVEGSGGNHG